MIGEQGVLDLVPEAMDHPEPIDALLNEVLRQSQNAAFTDDILIFWLQRDD